MEALGVVVKAILKFGLHGVVMVEPRVGSQHCCFLLSQHLVGGHDHWLLLLCVAVGVAATAAAAAATAAVVAAVGTVVGTAGAVVTATAATTTGSLIRGLCCLLTCICRVLHLQDTVNPTPGSSSSLQPQQQNTRAVLLTAGDCRREAREGYFLMVGIGIVL